MWEAWGRRFGATTRTRGGGSYTDPRRRETGIEVGNKEGSKKGQAGGWALRVLFNERSQKRAAADRVAALVMPAGEKEGQEDCSLEGVRCCYVLCACVSSARARGCDTRGARLPWEDWKRGPHSRFLNFA
jgi:hypothetical protein